MKVAKLTLSLEVEIPVEEADDLVCRMSHHADEFIDMEALREYGADSVSLLESKLSLPTYDKYICACCGANLYPNDDKICFKFESQEIYCEDCVKGE